MNSAMAGACFQHGAFGLVQAVFKYHHQRFDAKQDVARSSGIAVIAHGLACNGCRLNRRRIWELMLFQLVSRLRGGRPLLVRAGLARWLVACDGRNSRILFGDGAEANRVATSSNKDDADGVVDMIPSVSQMTHVNGF